MIPLPCLTLPTHTPLSPPPLLDLCQIHAKDVMEVHDMVMAEKALAGAPAVAVGGAGGGKMEE
jgi:hypothetical protein